MITEVKEERTMTVTLPPELESRVARKARAEGLSSEAYVERVVREATTETPREAAPLPEWPGHALNDLRREDLYDDAR
jgi:hypothetical protein